MTIQLDIGSSGAVWCIGLQVNVGHFSLALGET